MHPASRRATPIASEESSDSQNTQDTITTRFDVRSAEGTAIAVWVQGEGPAPVAVHGSVPDRTVCAALVGDLHADLTTYAIDRREVGATGDHEEDCLEREFEEVARVVDEGAARTGHGPVDEWGRSYGGSCAMGAANLTAHLGRLLLHESSLGLGNPPGRIGTYETMVAKGDLEGATALMFPRPWSSTTTRSTPSGRAPSGPDGSRSPTPWRGRHAW